MSKMVTPPVVTRMKAVLQKEMVREFLAEFLSTFVMMVSGWVAQGEQALRKGPEEGGAQQGQSMTPSPLLGPESHCPSPGI